MDRSDFLAVHLLKILHDRAVGSIVIVHIGDKEHARKISLLTEFPCLLGTDCDAVLTGDNDDSGICNTCSLLYFADKVEISGCIENIDLDFIPLYRDNTRADREFSFDFFLIVVADGISVCHGTHTACNPAKVSHRFCKCRLTRSAMAKKHNVSDSVSCIYLHSNLQKTFFDYSTRRILFFQVLWPEMALK